MDDLLCSEEATKYVWGGAIPLQIHLHPSDVASLPPPPAALVLGPRIGYLPLLIPMVKPHFDAALPPGVDAVWFDYKGLPLKWHIPIGVLFDILCVEPERPWNLTVHFRGYPSELLTPCEGEDTLKWSFINSMKEAAYIINGNCKNIMNMSQADQLELWQSIVKVDRESYTRVSSKLKLGPLGEDCLLKKLPSSQPRVGQTEAHVASTSHTGRIPIRLYIRNISEVEFKDATPIDTWDCISYINRPIEIPKEGRYFTLRTTLECLLPDIFNCDPTIEESSCKKEESLESQSDSGVQVVIDEERAEQKDGDQLVFANSRKLDARLIRIQGIEPDFGTPLAWIFNNLANPEYFLHICLFVASDDMYN